MWDTRLAVGEGGLEDLDTQQGSGFSAQPTQSQPTAVHPSLGLHPTVPGSQTWIATSRAAREAGTGTYSWNGITVQCGALHSLRREDSRYEAWAWGGPTLLHPHIYPGQAYRSADTQACHCCLLESGRTHDVSPRPASLPDA